jgi:hypothetical protein
MDHIWIMAIVAFICLSPVFLFRPLVIAIANRIAGKRGDSQDVVLLKKRVESLEQQLAALQHRLITVEDCSEFSKKLLEDMKKPTEK